MAPSSTLPDYNSGSPSSSAPTAILRPISDQQYDHNVNNGDSSSSSDDTPDMDPNEFDLLLSRSVPATGSIMLEPESIEYSMLRNVRSHSTMTRQRRQRRRSSVANSSRNIAIQPGPVIPAEWRHSQHGHSRQDDDDDDDDVERHSGKAVPTEQTPLLPPPPTDDETIHVIKGSGPDEPSKPDTIAKAIIIPSSSSSSSISTSSLYSIDDDDIPTPFLNGVSPARFWVLFPGLMATYFVASFDSTIMASSHPVITSYFGSSNTASWLSTAFLLTSTSFQPLVGGLSDAVGRKTPYLVTITIFLLATVWCALAQSMTSFIIARAVCGLGAGGMMSLGSIMVSDLVPIE